MTSRVRLGSRRCSRASATGSSKFLNDPIGLVRALGKTVSTNVPRKRLPEFVDLAVKIDRKSTYRTVIKYPLVRGAYDQRGSIQVPNVKEIRKLAAAVPSGGGRLTRHSRSVVGRRPGAPRPPASAVAQGRDAEAAVDAQADAEADGQADREAVAYAHRSAAATARSDAHRSAAATARSDAHRSADPGAGEGRQAQILRLGADHAGTFG